MLNFQQIIKLVAVNFKFFVQPHIILGKQKEYMVNVSAKYSGHFFATKMPKNSNYCNYYYVLNIKLCLFIKAHLHEFLAVT